MSRFFVVAIRQDPDSWELTTYRAVVSADSPGLAATELGNRIRAGDLDGVTVSGEHRPPGPGGVLDLVSVDAQRLADPRPDDGSPGPVPRTVDGWLSGDPVVCSCNHLPQEHGDRTGKCDGLDSYGVACECPSYEEAQV